MVPQGWAGAPAESRYTLKELLVTPYTVDVVVALGDGEQSLPDWWLERYQRGAVRAGGMPPEIPDPLCVTLNRETDPDSGDRFARVTLPLPAGTALGRSRELGHMLTSVLAAEGYTLRRNGHRVETLPGEQAGQPEGTLGGTGVSDGRVCSEGCRACVLASDNRLGCCAEGAAFSLADTGAALLNGDDLFVRNCLALPGEPDGTKWHPYLVGGRCVYHDRSKGCTLAPARMPLQCRTYLCAPERLLPPALLADYPVYVEALEEADAFVAEHMRRQGGVDFGSPLVALREAAAKAFATWAASVPADE